MELHAITEALLIFSKLILSILVIDGDYSPKKIDPSDVLSRRRIESRVVSLIDIDQYPCGYFVIEFVSPKRSANDDIHLLNLAG